jgi:hypothetical protein
LNWNRRIAVKQAPTKAITKIPKAIKKRRRGQGLPGISSRVQTTLPPKAHYQFFLQ